MRCMYQLTEKHKQVLSEYIIKNNYKIRKVSLFLPLNLRIFFLL